MTASGVRVSTERDVWFARTCARWTLRIKRRKPPTTSAVGATCLHSPRDLFARHVGKRILDYRHLVCLRSSFAQNDSANGRKHAATGKEACCHPPPFPNDSIWLIVFACHAWLRIEFFLTPMTMMQLNSFQTSPGPSRDRLYFALRLP